MISPDSKCLLKVFQLLTDAYEGDFCENDLDGCSQIECFEGVTCIDLPAPAVGAMCGPCPTGFTGDGEKCTGRSHKQAIEITSFRLY